MKHVLSLKVADHAGTLSRVVELFVSRGYNLDSICSGGCEEGGTQRMTIVTYETDIKLQRMVKLLEQLIDVYEVTVVNASSAVIKELLLVKILFRKSNLGVELREILSVVNSLKCNLIELNDRSICFEYVGSSKQIDSLVSIFGRYEVAEIARTGEAAIHV